MENYEQKYKEALGRANAKIETYNHLGHASVVKSICEIFPELKESEDERIREMIIHVINITPATIARQYRKEMLDWLEKQSHPQVRTGIEWVNTIDDACDKRYSEEYAHGEYCHEQSFKWGFQEGVDWLEKQGKKIDVIENFDTEFEKQVSHLIASIINKEHEYNEDFVKWTANALLNYAKHEFEKQGESCYPYQPGWRKNYSDNKPKIKHSVLMLTTHGIAEGEWLGEEWCQYRWSCKVKDTEVLYWMHLSDLENLEKENEKQGEQKPAWSEEDKNMLQNILECLKNGWSKLPTDILKYESWLKSIKERYTWSPSDEQMDALYTYIYNPQYFNSPDPRMELVESVYKDLKKLKEE